MVVRWSFITSAEGYAKKHHSPAGRGEGVAAASSPQNENIEHDGASASVVMPNTMASDRRRVAMAILPRL